MDIEINRADNDNMTCHAHANNARVVMRAPGNMPLSNDSKIREDWITNSIEMVKERHMDGIVFDCK